MPFKQLIVAFMMLALCVATACAPTITGEVPPAPVVTVLPPTTLPPAASAPLPTEQETPQPPPTPVPQPPKGPRWEADHRLAIDLAPIKAGQLELPLYGATGYASVMLPLWETRPTASPVAVAFAVAQVEVAPVAPLTAAPSVAPPTETTPIASEEVVVPLPEETAPPTPTEPPMETEQPALPSESPVVPPAPIATPDPFAGAKAVLPAGTPFTIVEEKGAWWRVKSDYGTGWIAHRYCMINLPDVVPSILYDATNSYASLYTTSGIPLAGITGESLYTGKVYNPRFEEEQFAMPVLYDMAKKICQAQQNALTEGNSLKLYEGYRPYKVQKAVSAAISTLAQSNSAVKAGVDSAPWKPSWFIASGYSNHQRGYAIDVSLVKVLDAAYQALGDHSYLKVAQYEAYEMPTPIHELSIAAITFTEPIDSYSQSAWKTATLSPSMNQPARALQAYCTKANLVPLASEWWHFNDIEAWRSSKDNPGLGGFEIKKLLGRAP